jgi:hypothetical protein
VDIPMWTGILALSVGAAGLAVSAWRHRSTRSVPVAALWLTVPLLGAVIAFLLGPPNLLMLGLGGTGLVLTVLTLAGVLAAPAFRKRPDREPSGRVRDSHDEAVQVPEDDTPRRPSTGRGSGKT